MTFDHLSCILRYPKNRLVHSSFGYFGRHRGGELPGSWFVNALTALEVGEAAVRQTLHRMERSGEVASTRLGRDKLYRPTDLSWAAIDAGAERLATRAEDAWDGRWTLVRLQLTSGQRVVRERALTVLHTEGFARLGNGVFLHPRDRVERICRALAREVPASAVFVFRGARRHGRTDAQLVSDLWDLRGLSNGYRAFLRRYRPIARRPGRFGARHAFGLRFAVVLDFLQVAWRDPDLPRSLLPASWPAPAARDVAQSLNDRLLGPARAFGDEVLDQVTRRNSRLAAHYREVA